ncbi:DUF2071 domain-containing protein [Streptomyces sp. NWU49]|uniref:DUF2071 domain-containing protein n=1 Tax=Streptomyces sp. NWU49 TaxID=2201153 RepID=UPI00215A179E|nr:DUF2071 domain-containing protein [Streptomyces sp. NWU49]
MTIRPGEPVRPTCRDVWLTSRWQAFPRGFGGETPVEHEPWPLRAARLANPGETLVHAAGLPPPAPPGPRDGRRRSGPRTLKRHADE